MIAHARQALTDWQRAHVTDRGLHATPADLRRVASVWGSYEGHLQHADSWRLRDRLKRQFPWLAAATARRHFPVAHEGRMVSIPVTKGLNA